MVARAQTEELREEVRVHREHLATAKADRRSRLAAITAKCRAMREAQTTDAQRRRAKLREAIAQARAIIANKCAKARGKTDEETGREILRAVEELDEARERIKLYLAGIELPPKDSAKVRAGRRRAELLEEEIDEVSTDLEGAGAPELVPVWRNMARRMPKRYRASPGKSTLEGFLEWAGDHSGAVADIQDKLLGRSVKDLEAREEQEQRELYDAREAQRDRAVRQLTQATAAEVRKLGDEDALTHFEAVVAALQGEDDDRRAAALRRMGDVLQHDLLRRGMLEFEQPMADSAEVPF